MTKSNKITPADIDLLNDMVKVGQVEITESHKVWGPESYKTSDGQIEVICDQGRFFGGGICYKYYSLKIGGEEVRVSEDFGEIQKLFLDQILKRGN